MAATQNAEMIHYIRSLATAQQSREQTDGELLRAFLHHRDERAFARLVRRHGSMVLRVCHRTLGNVHDAEDALQATFLFLAQKAAAIRKHESLASWLHGVAYRMAAHARRTRARQRTRESRVMPASSHDPALSAAARELQTILDEEIERLPETLRGAFVCVCLESQSCVEAAQQLGLEESAVRMRLSRARKRLQDRLTRRGVSLTAVLATMAAADNMASAAISPSLFTAMIQAAGQVQAGQPLAQGLVSAHVLGLVQGVNRTMMSMKVKLLALLLAAFPVAGLGFGMATYRAAHPKRPEQLLPHAPMIASPPAAREPSRTLVARPMLVDHDASDNRREQAKKYLEQALKALETADSNGRGLPDRALADVAVLQMKLGERAAATESFAKARRAIEALSEDTRIWELRVLAKAYAEAGDGQAVLDIVQQDIPKDISKNFRGTPTEFADMVLQEGAEALAKGGHERDALRLAGAIRTDSTRKWVRSQVRVDLALSEAEARDFAAARRTIAAMEQPVDQVTALCGMLYTNPTYDRYPGQPGLAVQLAKAGQQKEAKQALAEAVRLADKMPESMEKQRALAAVVCVQVRLGQLKAARRLLKGIVNEAWQNIATAAVVEALGADGDAKEAQALIERLPKPAVKVHALYHLAAGQARAGHREDATATFATAIEQADTLSPSEQSLEFHNIASSQATAGDFEAARETLHDRLHDAVVAQANIVYELAKSGHFKNAVRLGLEIRDEWWKANAVRSVARLQAKKGETKAARVWIDKLPSPLLQGNALLGLAEGLANRR